MAQKSGSEYAPSSSDDENSITSICLTGLHLDSEDIAKDIENKLSSLSVTQGWVDGIETSITKIYLNNNNLHSIPTVVGSFENLKVLNLSFNYLIELDETICSLKSLECLIARHNGLSSLPKNFGNLKELRELNLSGNDFSEFPDQLLELSGLRYLYFGSNGLLSIPKRIHLLQRMQILYLGGNRLKEIPEEMGCLHQLQILALCDNRIAYLPSSISHLRYLKSLLLHENCLTTLPPGIVKLSGLRELSIRGNPLVVNFVRDLTFNPPTLMELSGRVIRVHKIKYAEEDLPRNLISYLESAHHCVNPSCSGVYFDNRIEYIKFVDFCGKYHIPLLQYLCSSKCTSGNSYAKHYDSDSDDETSAVSNSRLRKVLLG